MTFTVCSTWLKDISPTMKLPMHAMNHTVNDYGIMKKPTDMKRALRRCMTQNFRSRFARDSNSRSVLKIVIAGCSYSTDRDFRQTHFEEGEYPLPYYSWSYEINRLYGVTNVAVPGFSMKSILHSLERSSYDFAIVNLTSINRGRSEISKTDDIRRYNTALARDILSQPNVYVWSPFLEWLKTPQVHSIIQRHEDEMFSNVKHRVTGNHLTQVGNNWMVRVMSKVIDKKFQERFAQS